MEIIKEATNRHCVIRTNTYTSTIKHLNWLLELANLDYPTLESQDVIVVCYGGKRYKRTFGIEFPMSKDQILSTYTHIKELEYTL